MYNTVSQRYKTAFAIIRNKSTLLWGLSLLTIVISGLISGLGGAVPIISIPICLALSAGMSAIYLKAIRAEKYETADIFAAFKDFETAKRVMGGMLWMMLWIFLWGLIPVAGIVFAIIKALEYSFTPYILMTRPEIGAMEALKESKRLTNGLKGRMFGAIIIPAAIYIGAMIVLGVFAMIPIIGVLFAMLLFCVHVAAILFLPLLCGLLMAGFYEGAINPPPPPPQYNGQYQPQYQPYPPYGQPNQQYQPYPQQQQYYQPAPQQPAAPAAPAEPTPAPEAAATPVELTPAPEAAAAAAPEEPANE